MNHATSRELVKADNGSSTQAERPVSAVVAVEAVVEAVTGPLDIRAARGGQFQRELALRLRVAPATVRNWEAGRTRPAGSNLLALRAYMRSVELDVDLGAERIVRVLRLAQRAARRGRVPHEPVASG